MEGNAHLLQLIRKMRSQINRLERENRALKGELQGCGQRAVPAPGDANGAARSLAFDREGPAATPASPRGPAAAPGERTGTGQDGCMGMDGAFHGTPGTAHAGCASPAGFCPQGMRMS